MKYFPLKTALACLILAPIVYIATLGFYQDYFSNRYQQKVEDIVIGDTQALLDGQVTIEKQIARNIYAFLQSDWAINHIGLNLEISVTTKGGKFIYPTFVNADAFLTHLDTNEDPGQIAKQNFQILNQGLTVHVKLDTGHGSNIGNLILFACFSAILLVFIVFYKLGSLKSARDNRQRQELIDGLKKEEQNLKQILGVLEEERNALSENIKSLNGKYQADKKQLKENEEELFDEIVSLEERLEAYIEHKQKKEDEIEELKSQIKRYERRKSTKNKRNEFDFLSKRFNVLYKNIQMSRRAISGLLNLTEDQQIKAEEVVHTLDSHPDNVIIKRKVFSGKKHKTTCFEVLFAYNGRLYFKKNDNSQIDVVVIGNKNSQGKDMDYLHNL